MHHESIRPRHALSDNEIDRALILLPARHATIYSDPRFVAVVWSVDASNRTTAQVLGCQRRCLPFLARYVSATTGLGIWATALRVLDRALPTHCRSSSKDRAEVLVPSACATTFLQMLRSLGSRMGSRIDKHLCLAQHQIQVAGAPNEDDSSARHGHPSHHPWGGC